MFRNVLFPNRLMTFNNGIFEKYFVIAQDKTGHNFYLSDFLKLKYHKTSDLENSNTMPVSPKASRLGFNPTF